MKNPTVRLCAAAPAVSARLALLPLALSAFTLPALAQTASSAPVLLAALNPLKETVVTATRTEQPLADLVADVSIIDRETIENSGLGGLADVLARLPGVEMSRNGGPGATTSLFLRGAETRFTAVYIDGVRVDSQSTGGAAWESIPLGLIDRIEVLRGPAGAVYGSDAIGGVVQIFTKKGEGAPQPTVGVGLGSLRSTHAEASLSGSQNGIDYALGVQNNTSLGFNARTVATANPDRDGYRSNSGYARLGAQLNRDHRLEATLLASNMNSGYDASLKADDRNMHRLYAAGLNWMTRWSDTYTSRVSVTESSDHYTTQPSPYQTTTRLRGYLWQNNWKIGLASVSAALERKEDHLVNSPIDRSRSQDALALGYGLRLGEHTLQLNVRHDRDSEFGAHNTGSVAYGYAITPAWRATASAGTAFRAPTLYQRFSEYGLASLQPETSRNLEVGLRYQQGGSLFGVVVYQNKVSNLINFGGAGACRSPFGCYANTGRAEYSGVTFTGEQRVASVLLRGSLDVQDPKDLTTNKQLARRARQHGTLGAETRYGQWLLGAEAQWSGRRYDNAANTVTLGGYTLFNLRASTEIAPDWKLLARVDNLADKSYQFANTYANAGRQLYVGLLWSPRR
ncbi:TonB-dependent receptor [Curvibacter sp. HBC28]|uniref:TonB-dependent receptor n=1 Tax=Curvibacter microcysteis TaxID=3026419 RepID=A0ABT5MKL4_9BURK|nr:TonB-dependent receptor [Curvibacter sp. HBC28]MDD0817128.1 TonB-dependent receptor [Curvibacter sp. HBC28]